jgi:putative flippase GtrA
VRGARFGGIRALIHSGLKFGVIGLGGFIVDASLFNLLRFGVLGTHIFQQPLAAKILSATIATVLTWLGNRYWSFREHRRENAGREFIEFAVVAVGGIVIGVLCLWVSHYLLGFTSILADNISSNVIGLFLATSFRFILYRFWVYGHHRTDTIAARANNAS